MSESRLGQHDPIADRAVETLRGFERARVETPAYRGPAWDRFLARLIDAAVLAALIAFAIMLWLTATASSRNDDDGRTPGTVPVSGGTGATGGPTIRWGPTAMSWEGIGAILAGAGVLVLYDVGTTLAVGATPGKRILNLEVVDARDQRRAGVRKLVVRSALLAIPLSFGFLMWFTSIFYGWLGTALVIVMFAWLRRESATPQALYDRWAGTQVVRTDVDG